MPYELGLQATLAVCLWIGVDLLGARGPRSRRLPILFLAASCATWALGELFIQHATEPEEVLRARRILHFGVTAAPIAWLWTGAILARARWLLAQPWLLALAAVPLLACYSFLFWDRSGLFLDWTAVPPRYGPVFWVRAGVAWALVAIGSAYFLVAASRVRLARWWRLSAIGLAGVLPMAGNALYLAFGSTGADPTPILLGLGGVAIRLAVIDSGFAAVLPMGQRGVLEQLRTGVLIADVAGIVIDANAAARALLGRRRVIGEDLGSLLDAARENPLRVVEVERAPLRTRLGVVGDAALLTDRTDVVRREREAARALRRSAEDLERRNAELARANRDLEEFASVASHDLQEPIRKLVAFSGLLREDLGPELPAPAARDLDFISQAAYRMHFLVQDLLTLSRTEGAPVEPRRVAVGECVDRALEALDLPLRESGAQIDREPLPELDADPTLLTVIYQNLIANGIKFVDGEAPRVLLTAEPTARGWILGVRDNGIGVADADAEEIFKPFRRLHAASRFPGTGIGLTICRKAVERHGGRIWLESEPGKGAHFRFTLGPESDVDECDA